MLIGETMTDTKLYRLVTVTESQAFDFKQGRARLDVQVSCMLLTCANGSQPLPLTHHRNAKFSFIQVVNRIR